MCNDQSPVWIKRRLQRLINRGVDVKIARRSLLRIEKSLRKTQKEASLASNVILFPSVTTLRVVEIITD
ncbi:hypothetical protein SAMN04487845_1306 [Methylobacterium sp. yr668]|nr:hypothetical protein SAMN04487845_1306 [Methylobacterium sp. yr668]